jgi:hypothetical protein
MALLKGIAAALVAIGLAVAVTLVLDRAARVQDEPPPRAGGAAPAGATSNTAVLFYVAEDGTALVTRTVEIPSEGDALTRARIVAQQQLAPPALPLISAFPAGTRLRAIYLTAEGNAFVDLSQHVSAAHPGGSLDELFTVYALVNALVSNVQEIAAVQILIEGREVDTLAGHVDLRRPLGLGMQWVGGIGPAASYEEGSAGE